MQGSTRKRSETIRAATVFAAAFLAGSTTVFVLADLLGSALGNHALPTRWRAGLAGAGLLSLAAVDVFALGKGAYCPLGWRRQTPRTLMRRYPVPVVLGLWGLDTGFLVTTFRVAAISWGAILLTGLGLSAWWVGPAYGLGFAVPFTALLFRHRVGRSARDPATTDPGLESMLGRRATLQVVSATLLVAGGGILIGGALA